MDGLTPIAFFLCAAFAVWFVVQSDPRQRTGVLLSWLFPGAGHLYLGHKQRGLLLGGLVLATFLAGLIIADFRNISPLDRHPIWGIAHFFGGLMSALTAGGTASLMIERDNPYYMVGCLYSGVACLLNILVMIDAYDLASAAAPVAATAENEETAA